jgi:mannitol/fructose-specific phosphotransferase system IIA component (Ntr-type)
MQEAIQQLLNFASVKVDGLFATLRNMPNLKSLDRISFVFLVKIKTKRNQSYIDATSFLILIFLQKSFATAIKRF